MMFLFSRDDYLIRHAAVARIRCALHYDRADDALHTRASSPGLNMMMRHFPYRNSCLVSHMPDAGARWYASCTGGRRNDNRGGSSVGIQ